MGFCSYIVRLLCALERPTPERIHKSLNPGAQIPDALCPETTMGR
jgi:hypothetical protein